ncbi:hypothetical protein H8356DRAFT_969060 [Neocallimastix lanati (nom. inval.)]|nr:hypothetical protein H8356DRAFT_971004 [Neocallimastix sp. JGI-2020a]KAG4081907.1 hypothetical protein H8356DRAFT_970703 [Neocallimastix sp. JGI-2020a]KAG4082820.1 hypothetical protein H8356DRAFT_969060 [Neocallimastix sp. JGI-2020a]
MNSSYINQLKTLLWKNFKIKKSKHFHRNLIFEFFFPILLLIFLKIENFEENEYEKEGSTKALDIHEIFNPLRNMYLGFVIPNITDTNINRSDFINNLIKNELFEYGYKNYNLESGTFLNENELINYTKKNNIKLLGEVKFYNYTNYVIRLNGETIVDPNSNAIGNYYTSRKNLDESNSTDSDSYLDIFSPLQIAINQAIIESKTNKKLNIDTFIGKMSKPEVFLTISEMNNNILTIGSLIYPLLFIIILINLIKSIISEKEKKQEEGLITIGVHPSILWLSWEIFYLTFIIEYIYKLKADYPLIEKIICICVSPINLSIALSEVNLLRSLNNYMSFSNLLNSDFGMYLLLMGLNIIFNHFLLLIIEFYSNRNITIIKKKSDFSTKNLYINDYEKDPINNGKPLLEVKNLFKLFRNKDKRGGKYVNVLNGLSFNVYNNEIFAILGHNGAGKSTLIKIMTGLLKSDHGSIHYNGLNITNNLNKIRKNIGNNNIFNINFKIFNIFNNILVY